MIFITAERGFSKTLPMRLTVDIKKQTNGMRHDFLE